MTNPQDDRRPLTYEDSEDIPTNPSTEPTLGDVINRRFGRRSVMRGMLATTVMASTFGPTLLAKSSQAATASFDFEEITHGVDETHHVAKGYDAEVLIRWGDPVTADAPAFDPENQTAEAQEKQFGYNNDYIGYVGLPLGSDNPDHGLLCVNHEYTNEEVMFPGLGRQDKDAKFSKA